MRNVVRLPLRAALLAALLCTACSEERRDILGTEKKLYSQYDEELIIRDYFQDRRGGTFLDVGAAHPIKNSTTYYLEKHLGWSGIGVDALPHYASAYVRYRPDTRFRNFIATDHSGTVESFYHIVMAPGLSSTTASREFDGKKLGGKEIEVPTTTLDELLDAEGITKLDFLSMDIEGGAPKALEGFSIERFRPDLACVELGGGERQAVLDYFERHGYEVIERYRDRDKVNWYFRPAP